MYQFYHQDTEGKGTEEYETYAEAYAAFSAYLGTLPASPYYASVVDPGGTTMHEVYG